MTPDQAAELYRIAYEAGRAAGGEFTSEDLRAAYDIGVEVGGKTPRAAHRHRFTRPRPAGR